MEPCKILYDFKNKENSRTFKHSYHKSTVFQGFQGLDKALINFKYFQALQGPVRTLTFKQFQFKMSLWSALDATCHIQISVHLPRKKTF